MSIGIRHCIGVLEMEQHDTEPLVYSVSEARKLLGISRGLAYEAIRTG